MRCRNLKDEGGTGPGGQGSRSSPAVFSSGSKWKLPSLDLLAPAEARSVDDKPLKEMAANIESALADHGVQVEVADIKSGPRIVRFGLQPGWVEKRGAVKEGEAPAVQGRVKVQSILARERDLSLAISSPSLRFEQVPGEALLGLEIPTPSPSKVTMREIMDGADFRKIVTRGGLPIALGADAGGDSVAMDLSVTAPHDDRGSNRKRQERVHQFHCGVDAAYQAAGPAADADGGPETGGTDPVQRDTAPGAAGNHRG